MTDFSAIILAAGNGTRFLSNTPKILHNIGGKSLFMHSITTLLKAGCRDIILLTDESYNTKQYTQDLPNVHEVYQKEKLGTGHAVQIAYPKISKSSEYVFVIYGDTPLIKEDTFSTAIENLQSDPSIAIAILSIKQKQPEEYGSLIITENGNVEAILEKGVKNNYTGNVSFFCNAGLLIRRDFLDSNLSKLQLNSAKKEILITDLINLSFKQGNRNIIIERGNEELIGINTREALAIAERLFQDRMRKEHLSRGVTLIAPETVFFSHDTKIGQDSTIYPNVFFGPGVTLGNENTVFPFSHLEHLTTEHNVKIGPFARIRGGSYFTAKAEIGNFVEIKKSNIGSNSKIKHLSYIGDTDMGSSCNIGAGTITCNYDGVNKFKSEIGDNVFIGSNSTIISPVKIEANSLIGAGTTITKDVPEYAMTVSRTPQKNLGNGAKKYFEKRKKKI